MYKNILKYLMAMQIKVDLWYEILKLPVNSGLTYN